MKLYGSVEEVVTMCCVKNRVAFMFIPHVAAPKQREKNISWIWILCQDSLTRELKIKFVKLVL